MRSRLLVLAACVGLVSALGYSTKAAQEQKPSREYPAVVDAAFLRSLEWRPIGPPRAGRAPAVAGDPHNPQVFYFGAAGGGVWKTYDAGLYWQNVSDGFFTSASVNAIAVSESDPNVIYVGTGETCTHPNVMMGDGVYKSTDAGKRWTHIGLRETMQIGRIVVHPTNPNLVYVAAMGHHFGYNPERGVYRSKDGGKTWQLVLFKSEKAGAVDIDIDPGNPNVLYASIWQFLRQPWSEPSGGPDSGFYKSIDGGDTWQEIDRNPGFPRGVLGKIGVSVSRSRPSRVYAVVEAAEGGLYRSDDSGAAWQLMNNQRDYRFLASSYMHVIADPKDPDTVYLPWMEFFKSSDGGRTLVSLPMPHSDHHALWIDPRNPQRMIEGSDGGAIVTLNGGNSWSPQNNQPTAQFFHVAVDNQVPYRVYATQMDSSAISTPSRTREAAIAWKDSYAVGTAESGSIVVRPDDPDIIIAGSIGSSLGGGGNMLRYDRKTGQQHMITVWPEDQYGSPVKDVKYRFHFTYPIILSPHDPNVVYAAANRVFRSTNQGSSWEVISPDLTRNDISKMTDLDGGPITSQQFSSQYANVIYALAESPLNKGELWAGTDDGVVHVSRDAGKSWRKTGPTNLAEWTTISTIEVSPNRKGTVYVAAHRYKLDDRHPYLLKTTDDGRTWQPITKGIPDDDFMRVIREDPRCEGLLFAGSERSIYVSFDAGATWQSLRLNLPVVPVHDLVVKDNDVVVATHGRSSWILDNITPLRQISREITEKSVHLFKVPTTYRLLGGSRGASGRDANLGEQYLRIGSDGVALQDVRRADGSSGRVYLNAGSNPPSGVWVTYYLKGGPDGEVTLAFLDAENGVIRQYSSAPAPGQEGPRVPARPGTNRFVWDMTYPGAREVPPAPFLNLEWARAMPPVAPPGMYKVRLDVGGQSYEQPFEIRRDPRVTASDQDLQAQFALMIKIRDRLSEVTDVVNELRKARVQVEDAEKRMQRSSAASLRQALLDAEGHLTRQLGPNPMLLPPKTLNIRLAALTAVVGTVDEAPTKQSYDVFEDLSARVAGQLTASKELLKKVADFLKASQPLVTSPGGVE